MVLIDPYLRGFAALVSASFAVVIFAGGPRRPANQFLAFFMMLIAGNQFAETMTAFTRGTPEHWPWFRIGAVCAALDPLMLYYFASVHPERNALNAPRRVGLVMAGSFLFVLGAFVMDPQMSRSFVGIIVTLSLTAFTAVVYTVVFLHVLRVGLDRPAEPSPRFLLPAMVVATLPLWTRTLDQVIIFVRAHLLMETGPTLVRTYVNMILLTVPVVATFIALALREMRRLPPQPRTRRVVVGSLALGIGVLLLVMARPVNVALASLGLMPDVVELGVFGRVATAIRWLLFGGLVSIAVLRHRMLGLSLAQRRLAARTFVVLMLAAVVSVAVFVAHGLARDPTLTLRPVDFILFGGLLVASQGVRSLVDRIAWLVYGVPMPGDERARQEAYRVATLEALRDGRVPSRDRELSRLRRELGLDETAARALEQVAELQSDRQLSPGQVFASRYRVERLLGRGGGGRTFLAWDEMLDRRVTLKEILGGDDDDDLLREARAAGSLQHPNILTVHDVIGRSGRTVLVTEHCAGGSLEERLAERGRLRLDEGLRLLGELLDGLAAVHARGIVHCDVKPANVLLTNNGTAKLADFGIARLRTEQTAVWGDAKAVVGSLAWMAPEQRSGVTTTALSDVYAVGALARAALPENLPPDVAAVVARALADAPDARWPSAAHMLEALATTPTAARTSRPVDEEASSHSDDVPMA